jgi:hypothetical protein
MLALVLLSFAAAVSFGSLEQPVSSELWYNFRARCHTCSVCAASTLAHMLVRVLAGLLIRVRRSSCRWMACWLRASPCILQRRDLICKPNPSREPLAGKREASQPVKRHLIRSRLKRVLRWKAAGINQSSIMMPGERQNRLKLKTGA